MYVTPYFRCPAAAPPCGAAVRPPTAAAAGRPSLRCRSAYPAFPGPRARDTAVATGLANCPLNRLAGCLAGRGHFCPGSPTPAPARAICPLSATRYRSLAVVDVPLPWSRPPAAAGAPRSSRRPPPALPPLVARPGVEPLSGLITIILLYVPPTSTRTPSLFDRVKLTDSTYGRVSKIGDLIAPEKNNKK